MVKKMMIWQTLGCKKFNMSPKYLCDLWSNVLVISVTKAKTTKKLNFIDSR